MIKAVISWYQGLKVIYGNTDSVMVHLMLTMKKWPRTWGEKLAISGTFYKVVEFIGFLILC